MDLLNDYDFPARTITEIAYSYSCVLLPVPNRCIRVVFIRIFWFHSSLIDQTLMSAMKEAMVAMEMLRVSTPRDRIGVSATKVTMEMAKLAKVSEAKYSLCQQTSFLKLIKNLVCCEPLWFESEHMFSCKFSSLAWMILLFPSCLVACSAVENRKEYLANSGKGQWVVRKGRWKKRERKEIPSGLLKQPSKTDVVEMLRKSFVVNHWNVLL